MGTNVPTAAPVAAPAAQPAAIPTPTLADATAVLRPLVYPSL